jgi:RNA polymerase sigma factor (sigma-70 family)
MGSKPKEAKALLRLTVERFLTGDTRQYEIIRRQVSQYVHHQNPAGRIDADEVVADTLRILYENLKAGRFRGDSMSALAAYTYSIARFSLWRAWNQRKRELPSSNLPDQPGPDEALQHEQRELVARIMEALDHGCRKLLSLKFFKGWQNQEIAAELGKNQGAVRTALTRCLQKAARLDFMQEHP